jgi:hypothetical protein
MTNKHNLTEEEQAFENETGISFLSTEVPNEHDIYPQDHNHNRHI